MIYPYACPACAAALDLIRPVAERDAPVMCPLCGRLMARQFVVPTVHFRGVGWASKPAIVRDAVAAGQPERNWAAEDTKDFPLLDGEEEA